MSSSSSSDAESSAAASCSDSDVAAAASSSTSSSSEASNFSSSSSDEESDELAEYALAAIILATLTTCLCDRSATGSTSAFRLTAFFLLTLAGSSSTEATILGVFGTCVFLLTFTLAICADICLTVFDVFGAKTHEYIGQGKTLSKASKTNAMSLAHQYICGYVEDI